VNKIQSYKEQDSGDELCDQLAEGEDETKTETSKKHRKTLQCASCGTAYPLSSIALKNRGETSWICNPCSTGCLFCNQKKNRKSQDLIQCQQCKFSYHQKCNKSAMDPQVLTELADDEENENICAECVS
jgi:hypothetical protein